MKLNLYRCIKTNNIEKRIAFIFIGFVILTLFLRAANSGITYDEAYTYTEYVERIVNKGSLQGARLLLNNHWLNTFLIALVTKVFGVRYSVILIRLPIIVFGVAYYCLVYRCYDENHIGLLHFFALTANYYLAEFFGLARGYGMATLFVLITIYIYYKWREGSYSDNRYVVYMLGTLLLAAYSNSISLLICPAMGIVIFVRMDKREILPLVKKYFIVLIAYSGLYIGIAYWHFMVSADDMPIYSYTGRKYPSIAKYVIDYIGMYSGNERYIYACMLVFVTICFLALVVRIHGKKRLLQPDNDMVIIAIILFFIMFMINAVFKKGGCTGRTLLPMFPVFVYAFFEFIEPIKEVVVIKERKYVCFAELLASFILIVLFIHNTSITKTSDWMWNYNQDISYRGNYFISNQIDYGWNAVAEFYSQKAQWDSDNLLSLQVWKKGCE